VITHQHWGLGALEALGFSARLTLEITTEPSSSQAAFQGGKFLGMPRHSYLPPRPWCMVAGLAQGPLHPIRPVGDSSAKNVYRLPSHHPQLCLRLEAALLGLARMSNAGYHGSLASLSAAWSSVARPIPIWTALIHDPISSSKFMGEQRLGEEMLVVRWKMEKRCIC